MHTKMIQALVLVIMKSQPARQMRDDEIFQVLATRNPGSRCTLRDIQDVLPTMVAEGILTEEVTPPYKRYSLTQSSTCPLERDAAQFCAHS